MNVNQYLENLEQNRSKIYYVSLFFLFCLPWFIFLNLPLINEDIHVLEWHKPEGFFDIFQSFYEKIVGGYYWRPVTYLSYSFTKVIYGENAIYYRLFNMFLHAGNAFLLYNILRILNISINVRFLVSLIFAWSYQNLYAVVWIPGRTDALVLFFLLNICILLFTSSSYKTLKVSVSFLLAVLSKEIAYAGLFLPFLIYYYDPKILNKKEVLKFTSIFASIILFTILYRNFVIGGVPFQSQNFADISFVGVLESFLIYPALSFFTADHLETIFFMAKDNPWNLLKITIIVIIFLTIIFYRILLNKKGAKKGVWGLLWYLAFIAPALTTLNQWYTYIPMVGILIFFAFLFNHTSNKSVLILVVAYLLASIFLIINEKQDREIASKKFSEIRKSMKKIDNISDRVAFFCLPDKIERVNTLKIGFTLIFNKFSNDSLKEFTDDLRCELNENAKIELVHNTKDSLEFNLINGRFLIRGGRSRAVPIDEEILRENQYYKIKIRNGIEDDTLKANAILYPKHNDIQQFYYNGIEILELENRN